MKNLLTTLSLLITFFSINFDSKAAIITAVISGAWNSPASWNSGLTPTCGDTIEIPFGLNVTITETVNLDDAANPLCGLVKLNIVGTLRFSNGKKLNLAAGSCINIETDGRVLPSKSGGGSSERIMIGGVEEWRAGDGTLNGAVQLGCAVILPLTFVEFTINSDSRELNFYWEVESEKDISSYSIEKSIDGITWTKINQTNSIGDHSSLYTYNYNELISKFEEISYYKLYSFSINGMKNQLAMKSVNNLENLESKGLKLFPNPVSNSSIVNLYFEETLNDFVELSIYNQLGKAVKTMQLDNKDHEKLFPIEILDLIPGSYTINLSDGEQNLKSKFAVL